MKDFKRMIPWLITVFAAKALAVLLGFDFSVDHALASGGLL